MEMLEVVDENRSKLEEPVIKYVMLENYRILNYVSKMFRYFHIAEN